MIRRIDSADWQTEDLHRLWKETPTKPLGSEVVALHAFLDYCRVLQEVRDCFKRQDTERSFDRVFFFLRGGYFAFSYLNRTFHLLNRAVIFGGLNHGIEPVEKLQSYVRSLAEEARRSGQDRLRILVIDEVKSGSGMGRIFKAIETVLLEPNWYGSIQCDLTFYAVRPNRAMLPALTEAVDKWSGRRKNAAPGLSISIDHFAGYLPGYDSDMRCGIRQTSFGHSPKESYDMVKHAKGKVRFVCKSAKPRIAFAYFENSCFVESLASFAFSLTNQPSGCFTASLQSGVDRYGCDLCKERLRHLVQNRLTWK